MVPAEADFRSAGGLADGRPRRRRARSDAPSGRASIHIASEGGFLPAPAVVENQPIAWNMDPTTFNMGNVSDHALLVAPAERADVIIDFSAYAGQDAHPLQRRARRVPRARRPPRLLHRRP